MPRRAERSLRSRGTDRVEAVIAGMLTVMAAAGLLLVVSAGASAHADVVERGHLETMTRVPTVATLAEHAPMVLMLDGPAAHAAQTTAAATWVAPDGTPCTGQVPVTTGSQQGLVLSIWTARDGTLADAPTSAAVAVFAAVTTAAAILLLTALVVTGGWWGTRRVTSMLNARAWEREWAAIEPHWRRNHR